MPLQRFEQDSLYEFCVWVSYVNQSQDMQPQNDAFCGTLFSPITSVETPTTPQISISPNPAQNYFQIELETPPYEVTHLRIFNTNGQIVQQHLIKESSAVFSTTDLVSGTYFIQIQQGEQVYNERLVVMGK